MGANSRVGAYSNKYGMCDIVLRNIKKAVNIRICMCNPCSIFKKIIMRTIFLKTSPYLRDVLAAPCVIVS